MAIVTTQAPQSSTPLAAASTVANEEVPVIQDGDNSVEVPALTVAEEPSSTLATFEPIAPSSPNIGLCQYLLPNRMQCPKAGAFLMTSGPDKGQQYCGQHMKMRIAGILLTQEQEVLKAQKELENGVSNNSGS